MTLDFDLVLCFPMLEGSLVVLSFEFEVRMTEVNTVLHSMLIRDSLIGVNNCNDVHQTKYFKSKVLTKMFNI